MHSQMVQSYDRTEKIWQSSVIIYPQTGNVAGVWMTSCPEEMVLRIWGFQKDNELRSTVEGNGWVFQIRLYFWGLNRQRWIEILNTTRCAARCGWGQHSMVRIGFYDLSLSPRVKKFKKLINSFVLPVFVLLLLFLMYIHTL